MMSLLLGILLACGEKPRQRAVQESSDTALAPMESVTTASPSTTAVLVSVPLPFPADRDTAPLAHALGTAASVVPTCGSRVPRITAESIGPFHPGMPLAELVRRCPRLFYGWVMISDGYPVPMVAARLGGVTITAFASDSLPTATLGQVEVRSPGPTTKAGFGLGSTLGQMERVYGAAQASESDCVLRIWFDSRPGIAFYMDYPKRQRRECGALSAEPLSPDLTVKGVVLTPK